LEFAVTADDHSQSRILGWHWFIDLSGCETLPTRADELEKIMLEAADVSGATVVQKCFHEFSPHGLTGVLVIAESHIAIHTWPEFQSVCIDIFSCTQKLNVEKAVEHLKARLSAAKTDVRMQTRHTL
jgi:S-adenosylmethionine decarboxylase